MNPESQRSGSAALWLGLQVEYDLRVARRNIGELVEKEIEPRTPQAAV